MPEWAGTDILNSKGRDDAVSTALATAPSVGGRDPATGGNPATGTTAQQTALSTAPVATGNPGNQPGNSPGPGYHWQGGGPDPQGPTTPQDGGRYVDPTYTHDATGRVLTPEEQAYWRDYDRRRAEAASIARSNNVGAKADPNKGLASNAVYDPITQTYSMVDSDGVWTKGLTTADLQSKLSDNLKKQYPDWWWGQYASQQNQARRYEVDAGAFDAQKFATMGQQSTRYGPTNF